MKSCLLLILVIVLTGFLISVKADVSEIEKIIQRRYKQYENDMISKYNGLSNKRSASALPSKNPVLMETEDHHHECDHDRLMHESGMSERYSKKSREHLKNLDIYDLELDEIQKRSTAQVFEPIRIFVNSSFISNNDPFACYSVGQVVTLDTSYRDSTGTVTNQWKCSQEDILDSTKIDLTLNYLLPTMAEILPKMLSVKPVTGNLTFSRAYHQVYGLNCRSNLQVPSNMVYGLGVPNADYYAIFTVRPFTSNRTLANAIPCSSQIIRNGVYDRPLAGSININPAGRNFQLSTTLDYYKFRVVIKTVLHEISHALGFTSDLFADYQTPAGGFYADGPFTQDPVTKRFKITTPRVVSWGQNYYGCPTLDGVELEDFNEGGGPGSHWEMRILKGEYMVGAAGTDTPISSLSLSFFEDMGWYRANYSSAELFRYGYKKGCNFVQFTTKPCSAANWGDYFCSTPGAKYCDGAKEAISACNIVNYSSDLPAEMQYFSDPKRGGKNGWADYCPIYEGFSNTYCRDVVNGNDYISRSNPQQFYFGNDSVCWNTYSASEGQEPACYAYRCAYSQTNSSQIELLVGIGSNWYICPLAGGQIDIPPLSMTLDCPSVDFFCDPSFAMAQNFTFDPNQSTPIPPTPVPWLPWNPTPSGGGPTTDDGWVAGTGLYFWLCVGLGILAVAVIIGVLLKLCC